jgi:hypothetical protein
MAEGKKDEGKEQVGNSGGSRIVGHDRSSYLLLSEIITLDTTNNIVSESSNVWTGSYLYNRFLPLFLTLFYSIILFPFPETRVMKSRKEDI